MSLIGPSIPFLPQPVFYQLTLALPGHLLYLHLIKNIPASCHIWPGPTAMAVLSAGAVVNIFLCQVR